MTANPEDTQPAKKIADLPLEQESRNQRAQRRGLGRRLDYWLLWLVALGSLALNAWLINTWLTVRRDIDITRQQIVQAVSDAANGVGQLKLGTIDYTVHVDEVLPLDVAIPISDTLVVPISETIKVNSTAFVNLPIYGAYPIPFSINVPIHLDVTIPISRTYQISDTIPILFDVPISIDLDGTSLGGLKTGAREYLNGLAQQLAGVTPTAPAVTPEASGTPSPQ